MLLNMLLNLQKIINSKVPNPSKPAQMLHCTLTYITHDLYIFSHFSMWFILYSG